VVTRDRSPTLPIRKPRSMQPEYTVDGA
jgi:hypothetical protein